MSANDDALHNDPGYPPGTRAQDIERRDTIDFDMQGDTSQMEYEIADEIESDPLRPK